MRPCRIRSNTTPRLQTTYTSLQLQYLAAEGEAAQLPSNSTLFSYKVPAPKGKGGLDPNNVNIVGQISPLKAFQMVHQLFARSCEALMANATVLAAAEVRLQAY